MADKIDIQLNVRLAQAGQEIAEALIAEYKLTGEEKKIMDEICSNWVAGVRSLNFKTRSKFFETSDGILVLSDLGKNTIIKQFVSAFKIKSKDYRNNTVKNFMICSILRIIKTFMAKEDLEAEKESASVPVKKLLHYYFTEEEKENTNDGKTPKEANLMDNLANQIYNKIECTDGGIDNVIKHWVNNEHKDVLKWHLKNDILKVLAKEVHRILWNRNDGILHRWFSTRYYCHKGPHNRYSTHKKKPESKMHRGPDELKNNTILKF